MLTACPPSKGPANKRVEAPTAAGGAGTTQVDAGAVAAVPSPCGNGKIDPGEVCDGALLAERRCEDLGLVSGALACKADCSAYELSGCDRRPPPVVLPAAGRPKILQHVISGDAMSEYLPLSFQFLVGHDVDPALLVGGTLVDADDETAVLALLSQPTPASPFVGAVTWQQLQKASPTVVERGGTKKTIRARFFDRNGEAATFDWPITLACARTNEAACGDGVCRDVMASSEHCGACANDLRSKAALTCSEGKPVCKAGRAYTYCDSLKECFDLQSDRNHCGACGQALTNPNESCGSGRPACQGVVCHGVCQAWRPADPALEVCNGVDDDCDGNTDHFQVASVVKLPSSTERLVAATDEAGATVLLLRHSAYRTDGALGLDEVLVLDADAGIVELEDGGARGDLRSVQLNDDGLLAWSYSADGGTQRVQVSRQGLTYQDIPVSDILTAADAGRNLVIDSMLLGKDSGFIKVHRYQTSAVSVVAFGEDVQRLGNNTSTASSYSGADPFGVYAPPDMALLREVTATSDHCAWHFKSADGRWNRGHVKERCTPLAMTRVVFEGRTRYYSVVADLAAGDHRLLVSEDGLTVTEVPLGVEVSKKSPSVTLRTNRPDSLAIAWSYPYEEYVVGSPRYIETNESGRHRVLLEFRRVALRDHRVSARTTLATERRDDGKAVHAFWLREAGNVQTYAVWSEEERGEVRIVRRLICP